MKSKINSHLIKRIPDLHEGLAAYFGVKDQMPLSPSEVAQRILDKWDTDSSSPGCLDEDEWKTFISDVGPAVPLAFAPNFPDFDYVEGDELLTPALPDFFMDDECIDKSELEFWQGGPWSNGLDALNQAFPNIFV